MFSTTKIVLDCQTRSIKPISKVIIYYFVGLKQRNLLLSFNSITQRDVLYKKNILPHYLINNTIYGKLLLHINCVF